MITESKCNRPLIPCHTQINKGLRVKSVSEATKIHLLWSFQQTEKHKELNQKYLRRAHNKNGRKPGLVNSNNGDRTHYTSAVQ